MGKEGSSNTNSSSRKKWQAEPHGNPRNDRRQRMYAFPHVFKRMGDGQGILSFPFKGYTLAIDFPVSKALLAFTPKLDEKVQAAGGRLYLGKDALLNESMFKAMYPQFGEWAGRQKEI